MNAERPKVTVITGASAGLGRALCQQFLQHGSVVAGIARREAELAELAALHPDRFLPVPADIADTAAVDAAFDRIREVCGPVSTLINNAAVHPRRSILDETAASFERTMQVNLTGMVACTVQALRDMVPAGQGRIVNVTSYAGDAPAPLSAAYSVSKGACRIFTKSLVADLHAEFPHIVVSEWIPGIMNTEMGPAHGIDPRLAARWGYRLAQMQDPGLAGILFERDSSVVPPRGLRQRIRERLTGRRPTRIMLD
ncbi:SDR family oxidoreductase [Paracoccus sp. PARArs4]|uniref:SDR family oxidoreductase n=1 Tax=Paracoccus sp. PARArs4 TaxID=2853442 RepID=UPI0024A75E0F|nr:SDR family oxidoreductase [Paracoccus sp. PARArs4]